MTHPNPSNDSDFIQRFHLQTASTRGVIVRLDGVWQQVRSRGAYTPAVATMLGECLAATALFAGDIKMAAVVSVTLRANTALRTLFAECTPAGSLRAIARCREDGALPQSFDELGDDAVLAITLDWPERNQRQQGMVPLDGAGFADAFAQYFERSEQLPTRLLLVADNERCAGMLVQQVAARGGDAPGADDDGFERVSALFGTLRGDELATLAPEEILRRLFHEEEVLLQPRVRAAFGCRCSRERVAAVLLALGADEAAQTLAEHGTVEVHCEFCNQRYEFDAVDITRLFHVAPPLDAPPSTQ
jgi:molecular chaperone Hsp33